jgi:hypothetical protein
MRAAIGAAIVALIVGAIWHYTTLKAERDEFMLKAAQEQQAHAQTKASFRRYEEDVAVVNDQRAKSLAKLAVAKREAEKQTSVLRVLLSKHDLGQLAALKPKLIEKRANKATAKVFADLEAASQ